MFGGVYVGTPLHFLPQWVADAWRIVNFGLMLFLIPSWIGLLISTLRGERRVPAWTAWGHAALLVFAVKSLAMQVERWHTPLVWEQSPSLTVALILALANLTSIHRGSLLRRA